MRLVFVVLSQFFSGSIWFAANVAYQGQGALLSALQVGFIIGTLGFAFFNIADRFSPAGVFLFCAVFGACFNALGMLLEHRLTLLLVSRLMCGISLAGIYPVGMKIAASWYPETISKALGWLVGALVLAAGLPYLIRAFEWQTDAGMILPVTSGLCLAGGLIQRFGVGDGPHLPRGAAFDPGVLRDCFRIPRFRASALGYFGHMWELYALYAHIPVMIRLVDDGYPDLWTVGFFVSGFAGCAFGGSLALKTGSRKIAMTALFASGVLCLSSPLLPCLPPALSLFLIMVWGLAAAMDSPQFSSMNALYAPSSYVGSALTIVTCIGFLITIITIELAAFWIGRFGPSAAFVLLAPGPFLGWLSIKKMP